MRINYAKVQKIAKKQVDTKRQHKFSIFVENLKSKDFSLNKN